MISSRVILQRGLPRCFANRQVGSQIGELPPREDGIIRNDGDIRSNYTDEANRSKDMTQTIKEKMQDVGKKVKEVKDKAWGKAEDLKEDVKDKVEEKLEVGDPVARNIQEQQREKRRKNN
ncbi:hypothetical protein COOONC_26174 [Cooperia oncophora]